MILEINKNFEEYRRGVWKGLTWRELIFGILALASTCTIVFTLHYFVGLSFRIGIHMAFPFTAFFGLNGFIKVNGMTFGEVLSRYKRTVFGQPLIYASTEQLAMEDAEREMEKAAIQAKKKEKKLKQKKKLKHEKKQGKDKERDVKAKPSKKNKKGLYGQIKRIIAGVDQFQTSKGTEEPVFRSPKYVQQTLDVEKVTKSGIFQLPNGKYSKAYRFSDINYSKRSEEGKEDIFSDYCRFINSMKVKFKIQIMNTYVDEDVLEKDVFFQQMGDELDEWRDAYNQHIAEKIEEGCKRMDQGKYIITVVERKNREEAWTYFNSLENSMQTVFKDFDSNLVPLSGEERINLLAEALHPDSRHPFKPDYGSMEEMGRDWKNDICPSSLKFNFNDFTNDGWFGRVLFLKKLPTALDDD